jgi:hypothetical protein
MKSAWIEACQLMLTVCLVLFLWNVMIGDARGGAAAEEVFQLNEAQREELATLRVWLHRQPVMGRPNGMRILRQQHANLRINHTVNNEHRTGMCIRCVC